MIAFSARLITCFGYVNVMFPLVGMFLSYNYSCIYCRAHEIVANVSHLGYMSCSLLGDMMCPLLGDMNCPL